MNGTTQSFAVVDPDDPLFKQLRHRYYHLGSRRRKILEDILAVPRKNSLGKEAERSFLFQIVKEGRMIDLLKGVEREEAEAQSESERSAGAQG
jgi:hypothetical protein